MLFLFLIKVFNYTSIPLRMQIFYIPEKKIPIAEDIGHE